MTHPPPSPKHVAVEFLGNLLVAGLALAFLCALSGCYGAPIDTRDIDADEVTITTHTPWSQTTVTAKGWRSRVKAQSDSNLEPTGMKSE